jgi:hypothetical protein
MTQERKSLGNRKKTLIVQLTADEYKVLVRARGGLTWRQWMLTKAFNTPKKTIDARLDALVEYETLGGIPHE